MKIAAEMRLKHGPLRALCQKHGGVKGLAEKVGIGHQTLGHWVRLKKCPTPGVYNRWYTEEVEARLVKLSGVAAIDLFPPELKEATEFFRKNPIHVVEAEIPNDHLIALAVDQSKISNSPSDQCIANEFSQIADDTMKDALTPREYSIVKLRLQGETLEEVGHAHKITKERVRQIESVAVRKLRQPQYAGNLVDFAIEPPVDFKKLDAEREKLQSMTLKDRLNLTTKGSGKVVKP